jgi:chitodextrinase
VKKLLIVISVLFSLILSVNVYAQTVSSNDTYLSFANYGMQTMDGKEARWMCASMDSETLRLGYGGNNYSESVSGGTSFKEIKNSDGTVTLQYKDRILVGSFDDGSVKMLPIATYMNTPGSKWMISNDRLDFKLNTIRCVTDDPSVWFTLNAKPDYGFFLSSDIDADSMKYGLWQLENIDKNIVFNETFQYEKGPFQFWIDSVGTALPVHQPYTPGIYLKTQSNGEAYNINKSNNDFDYKDYTVEAKVAVIHGKAGIIFRNDGHNMYLWSLDRENSLAELFVIDVVTGQKVKLKSKVIKNVFNDEKVWCNEKVTVQGNKLALYLDGEFVDSAEDNTSSNGFIGYWACGRTSAYGEALFQDITVKNEVTPIWYRSISSVHDDGTCEEGTVIGENITDLNSLNIKPLSTSNYWMPWVADLNLGTTDGQRYIFQTAINVPENVSDLVLTKDGTGDIEFENSRLGVFVNGRRVAYHTTTGIPSITIDRKYLMAGAKNDILIILYDTNKKNIQLSKLKIVTNLDPSYDNKKIIEYNGFKIQYDETSPINSKIIKYPAGIMIDDLQMREAENAIFDGAGNETNAYFSAAIKGAVYKYNGAHKVKKIFSPKDTSTLDISISNFSSKAKFKDVIFEQTQLDIFNLGEYATSIDASVFNDESISINTDSVFKFFGADEICWLDINIKNNSITVGTACRFMPNQYVRAIRAYTDYEESEDVSIDGGFTFDFFNENISNYNIGISTYDGAKICMTIPEFSEILFTSATINKDTIAVSGMEFNFTKDCIIEGLRPGSTPPSIDVNFKEISFNKNATGIDDLLEKLDITVTMKKKTKLFGDIYLAENATLTGTTKDKKFSMDFDGSLLLPVEDEENNQRQPIPVKFSIDSEGEFDFSATASFPDGLEIMGLDLSVETGVESKVTLEIKSAEYDENYVKTYKKKIIFSQMENVGADFDISGEGKVKFYMTKFALNEDGEIEDIEASIKGNLSMMDGNMLISTDPKGKIDIFAKGVKSFIFDAKDVLVTFPNVGEKSLEITTSFTMSTDEGLVSLKGANKNVQWSLLDDLITIEGIAVNLNKEAGKYSLTVTVDSATCDVNKAIPDLDPKFEKIPVKNLSIFVDDIVNPSLSVSCEEIKCGKEFDMDLGLKFKAKGFTITMNGKDKSIGLIEPTFLLPSFGGLTYYTDKSLSTKIDDRIAIGVKEIKAGYVNNEWKFSVGAVNMPGAIVYNLFELDVCKVVMADVTFGDNEKNEFRLKIGTAAATVNSGYSVELYNVEISSDQVLIKGTSMTIPEINIGGMGISNLTGIFGVETIHGKDYSFFGGNCTITIPGLGAVEGYLNLQNYPDNFFGKVKGAHFELTLGKAIPLGSTGISLKTISGSLARGELPKNFPTDFKPMFGTGSQFKMISMKIGLVDTSSGGEVIDADAAVWVELTNWGFALDANASIFKGTIKAKAGVAYANNIFAARAEITLYCIEGKVLFYVYDLDGKTTVSGDGTIRLRLEAGKILNKRIWRWKVKVPKNDLWFEGLNAKFGRFTNGKNGVQVAVKFPILGSMSAFVGDGGLKFFTNYDIYIPTKKLPPTPLAAYTPAPMPTTTGSLSSTPLLSDITENGKKTGSQVAFSVDRALDRVILIASTDAGIPNITIKYKEQDKSEYSVVPMDNKNISIEEQEVNEVDLKEKETGKIGQCKIVTIEKPGLGDWIIEARNDQPVDLAILTRLIEASVSIQSAVADATAKTLTVKGQIINSVGPGKENVTLLLKGVAKNTTDPFMPSERILATSRTDMKDMAGITTFTIATDGTFSAIIDTSVMKSGAYSLAVDLERTVTIRTDGEIFNDLDSGNSNDASMEESTVEEREDYKEGGIIKVFELNNLQMQMVEDLKVKVSGDAKSKDMYNLDVSFKATTRTADGYMMFADCYVDGVLKGTRKTNLGNTTSIRIGGYTEYQSKALDGSVSKKPVQMFVYIVPYQYINPKMGFVYDFGTKLGTQFGFDEVVNNIKTGPYSDKVPVWIEKSTEEIILDADASLTSSNLPVEGQVSGTISVTTSKAGTMKAEVESVPARVLTVGGKEVTKENVTVVFEKDLTEVASNTGTIGFSLVANIGANEITSLNEKGQVKIRLYSSANPDDFRILTVNYTFLIPSITITDVMPSTLNDMTGGTLDIYGSNFVKGSKVILDGKELQILDQQSSLKRIVANVPDHFGKGSYELKVVGPTDLNGAIWKELVEIVKPEYTWVKLKDQGTIQKGTAGKFYFSVKSAHGYVGKANINILEYPAGWTVQLDKTLIDMNEVVTATVFVPIGETVETDSIEISGVNGYDNTSRKIGDLKVNVTDTAVVTSIASLSKNKARPGEVITIYGQGFISPNVEIITLNGPIKLEVLSSDPNIIQVRIPANAASGNLRVTCNGQTSGLVPFTVIPTGYVTNISSETKVLLMLPGETTTVDVLNNTNPMSASSSSNIIIGVDRTNGKATITVPADTKPGKYEAVVNVDYPNTKVQTYLEIYVVNTGKTSETLSRQVMYEGGSLSILFRGKNVNALRVKTLTINGTAFTRVPISVSEGWDLKVGMVKPGSVIKYQVEYDADGTTVQTPVYTHTVPVQSLKDENDFTVSLKQNVDGKTILVVKPKGKFDPSTMSFTYKINGGPDIKVDLLKDNGEWVADLGPLPEGTILLGKFTYGDGTMPITLETIELIKEIQHVSNIVIPVTFSRNSTGEVIAIVPFSSITMDGQIISPSLLKFYIVLEDKTTLEVPMNMTSSGYIGNLGVLQSGVLLKIEAELINEGTVYHTGLQPIRYTDIGYEQTKNGLIAQYFDQQNLTDLRLETVDPVINLAWGSKAPAGGLVNNTTYSMRWFGKLQPKYSEEYTLFVKIPNGSATLWINDVMVFNGNGSQMGKITLPAGLMASIVLEYTSAGNGGIKLEWQSSSQRREVVPTTRLYAEEVQIPGDDGFNSLNVVGVTTNSVSLGWNAPKGSSNVAKYEVYEGNTKVADTTNLEIVLTGLKANAEYTYQVHAKDATGTVLAQSNVISVKTNGTLVDLAYNKSIIASSMDDASRGANKANDGNITTRWSSTYSDSQWIQVDLGAVVEIVKVKLNWEVAYGKAYTLQVSMNGTDWTDVYSTTTGDGGVDEIELDPVQTKYVRMMGLKRATGWGYSLYDFQVYGYADVAQNTTFFNAGRNTTDTNIYPYFRIFNTGSTPIDLSTVNLRYYYTIDGDKDQIFMCDWSTVGSDNVTGKFVKMATSKANADYYMEVGFTSGAGYLNPGQSVEVMTRFHKNDWTNYTQTNDYSYEGVNATYVDFHRIGVYSSGKLIQGFEP